jgi:glycosyltransferase involved in cell wall biosynthesis
MERIDNLADEPFDVTILISTKDRKDDLCKALDSAITQRGSIEILVISDGSTDGTGDCVRERYPTVRLVEHEISAGLIVRRNEGVRMARGRVVVIMDDDAVFEGENVVEANLRFFDDPRVGAVAIPYIDVNVSTEIQQQAPDEGVWAMASFRGTAQALRKSDFIRINGFCEAFFHQGEESEYCLRLLDIGKYVVFGTTSGGVIHHFESPKRDFRRRDIYGRRNDIFGSWLNMPMGELWWRLPLIMANGILFGFKVGRPWPMVLGVWEGILASIKFYDRRTPVKRATFQRFLRLRKAPERLQI